MSNIKKILALALASTIIAACQSQSGWLDYSRPATLNMTPPSGSAAFKQGWLDGCHAGLATVNTDVNMMLASHKYEINSDLWQTNPHYKSAWKDAYYYCTYHMFSGMMNAF